MVIYYQDFSSTPRRAPKGAVARGMLHAASIVPLSFAAWVLLAQTGWMTAVIPALTAVAAVALYRSGSRGWITGGAAAGLCAIVFGTTLLAATTSLVLESTVVFAPGESPFDTLSADGFWPWLTDVYGTSGATLQHWAWVLALASLIAAVGAIPPLVGAFRGRGAGARATGLLFPVSLGIAALTVIGVLTAASGGSAAGWGVPQHAAAAQFAVGECLVIPPDAAGGPGQEFDPTTVACESPHDAEVFAVGTLSDTADSAPYPGEQAAYDQATAACPDPFLEFVGMPVESSSLVTSTTFPSRDSWAVLDRSYACLVQDPLQQTVGTLRAAGR